MIMGEEALQLITLGAVILGAAVNIGGFVGKRDAQIKTETQRDMKIDEILSKVGKIDRRQDTTDCTLAGHEKRITVIETTLDISPKAG